MTPKKIAAYTVWVGGVEVVDEEQTLSQAMEVVQYWEGLGYDDVRLERMPTWIVE